MHIRGSPRTTNQERREHEASATHQHYLPWICIVIVASLVIRSACRNRATQIAGIVVAIVVNIVYSVFCAVTFRANLGRDRSCGLDCVIGKTSSCCVAFFHFLIFALVLAVTGWVSSSTSLHDYCRRYHCR